MEPIDLDQNSGENQRKISRHNVELEKNPPSPRKNKIVPEQTKLPSYNLSGKEAMTALSILKKNDSEFTSREEVFEALQENSEKVQFSILQIYPQSY